MSKPFTISFGFPLENSTEVLQIMAMAELHHSNPYYVIDSFHFDCIGQHDDDVSLLPPVEIERIQKDGKSVWVHRDSQRESQLGMAIGKAIQKRGGEEE